MKQKISVVIVSKNSVRSLPECLESINNQKYDPEKIEIEVILVDGGSNDGTIEYALKNGAIVIAGGYSDNQEARRYIGIQASKGHLIIFIDTDNMLPEENWVEKMIQPFQNPNVGCSFTKWYGINNSMSSADKYYALMGGNDSVSYYLNKNDRVPLESRRLPIGARLIYEDSGSEYVEFNSSKIPTLGCNGFVVRADIAKNLKYTDPEMFMHIDANIDFINTTPNLQYAIVKTSIYHNTGKNLLTNLKKRIAYKTIHSDRLMHYRKYHLYDKKKLSDNLRLILIIIMALTLMIPTLRALYGLVRTKRIEWIYHPFDVLALVILYGYSVVLHKFKQV